MILAYLNSYKQPYGDWSLETVLHTLFELPIRLWPNFIVGCSLTPAQDAPWAYRKTAVLTIPGRLLPGCSLGGIGRGLVNTGIMASVEWLLGGELPTNHKWVSSPQL